MSVDRGADPNVPSSEGFTPHDYMIEMERLNDAEHLRRALRLGKRE